MKLIHRGKVRDLYDLDEKRMLMIATDRISAHDIVLLEGIPHKGEVLSRLTAWWVEHILEGVPNHFIALLTERNELDYLGFRIPPEFHGRTMIVRKAQPYIAECIVRGHISGSGWKDYEATGMMCGISLPVGLLESQKLEEILFTPSTKAPLGTHDANISFDDLRKIVGQRAAVRMRFLSMEIFIRGVAAAREKGIIIADTKFEFGVIDGEIALIDEALTPDSSRFWPMKGYEPGHAQPSFDKQEVRDWLAPQLASIREHGVPEMPPGLVRQTSEKYLSIYRLMTGYELKLMD